MPKMPEWMTKTEVTDDFIIDYFAGRGDLPGYADFLEGDGRADKALVLRAALGLERDRRKYSEAVGRDACLGTFRGKSFHAAELNVPGEARNEVYEVRYGGGTYYAYDPAARQFYVRRKVTDEHQEVDRRDVPDPMQEAHFWRVMTHEAKRRLWGGG